MFLIKVLCLVFFATLIYLILPLRQILRERLVQHLIYIKSSLALEVSDWTLTKFGYTQAIKATFIWGKGFQLLKADPKAKSILIRMRVLGVLELVFTLIALGIFTSFFIDFMQNHP